MLRERGFTLIELLAAVSIVSILAVAGVPSFTQLLARQRLDALMQRLDATLALARSTAITRRQPVIVCPRGADGTCAPGLDWSGGWIVALEHRQQPGTAGETLWVQTAVDAGGDAVILTATRPLLRYRSDGTSPGSNLSIRLCIGGQLQAQQVISNAGRARRERLAEATPCPV